MKLNIQLKPVLIPKLSISPINIQLSVGSKSAYFQISIQEDFPYSSYELEWIKLKDMNPSFYSPVKKSLLSIM